jgi:subtilisin-like proprotein convertase family protein
MEEMRRVAARSRLAHRSRRRMLSVRLMGFGLAALVAALIFGSASASAAVFTNPTPIAIPDQGGASPYPSELSVSGMRGPISDLKLTLHRFGHTNPRDVDILLASPDGATSVVMSDACGDGDIEDYTWTFPTSGGEDMGSECPEFVYRPTDLSIGRRDNWDGVRPGPHPLGLFHHAGAVDANGLWKLYVIDDAGIASGDIEGGWSLTIDTFPVAAFVPGGGTSGPADKYPLIRTVTGETGVIADANVIIPGIGHYRPDDLDVLLVGPRGQKVTLMSDACGTSDSKGTFRLFDDEAAESLPDGSGGDGCRGDRFYRPTDHEPGETLPAPAPPGPYETSLSALDGTDPNGQWKLYVNDDSDGEDGYLLQPFLLELTNRPRANVAFGESAVQLGEGETRRLRLRRSAPSALGAGSVRVTSSAVSASPGSDFRPVSTTVEFAAGEAEKTVPVNALQDGEAEGPETFRLTLGDTTGDAEAPAGTSAVVTIRSPAPVGDRKAPLVSKLRLSPTAFAVARRSTARVAARGTRIGYSLSERARVTLRFQRYLHGRRGRRYVTVGTLRRATRPGRNRVSFSGRIGRRALRRGSYRLVVTAVDAAGNRSVSRKRSFRIVGR